jgi:hypothetical protein
MDSNRNSDTITQTYALSKVRLLFPPHVSFSLSGFRLYSWKKTLVNTNRNYGPFTLLLMKNKQLKHLFFYIGKFRKWKPKFSKIRFVFTEFWGVKWDFLGVKKIHGWEKKSSYQRFKFQPNFRWRAWVANWHHNIKNFFFLPPTFVTLPQHILKYSYSTIILF